MHTINVVQRHNRNFLAIHLCVTNNRFWLICTNDLTRIWSKFICVTVAHIKHNKQSNDDYYSRYMNSYCHFVWFSVKSDFCIIVSRQLRMWETELKSMPYVRTTNFQIFQLSGIKWNVPPIFDPILRLREHDRHTILYVVL